jgi:formylglycine-generating enzyme required for sulfatase activity
LLASALVFPDRTDQAGLYGNQVKIRAGYLGLRGYRLPTEAEWEFACRAGSESAYSFGEPADLLAKYAWYMGNSPFGSHSVGTLRPNEYGVFDMHGNAHEWTQSASKEVGKTEGGRIRDDKEDNTDINNSLVLRGGSFVNQAVIVRSANRVWDVPSTRHLSVGFRPARTFTP